MWSDVSHCSSAVRTPGSSMLEPPLVRSRRSPQSHFRYHSYLVLVVERGSSTTQDHSSSSRDGEPIQSQKHSAWDRFDRSECDSCSLPDASTVYSRRGDAQHALGVPPPPVQPSLTAIVAPAVDKYSMEPINNPVPVPPRLHVTVG